MVTAEPGTGAQGTQMQVRIPHPRVQRAILADPQQSADARHDVRAINGEEERLNLIDRGHARILFQKLRHLDDKLHDVVEMRQAEAHQALAGVEDKTMTKAEQAIRSAQDLLAATSLEKEYHWQSMRRVTEQSKEMPSQRAMAAAEEARARLHAKWLRSHSWAMHRSRLHDVDVRSEALVARPAFSENGHTALQAAVGDFGMSEGPPVQTPTSEDAQQAAEPAERAGLPGSSPLQVAAAEQAANSAAEAADGGGPVGVMHAAPAPVVEAYRDGVDKHGAPTQPPPPPPFHPCTHNGCDMARMLNMPPLVDEYNRSWVGDDTNRTWLDKMTGGKYTGSVMKDSPFEEIGGGPGQWFTRRFDKETVPGWWETEPGPGDAQGGMIPGAHDRVYHGLERNTKGEWKKEADDKGEYRWVFYSPWRQPKPEISEKHGIGTWATEKRADGGVRWVWCGPEGMAGADGDKSVDGFGQVRMAQGACHSVHLEHERLALAKEKKLKEEEAKKREMEEEEEERKEDEAAREAEVEEEIREGNEPAAHDEAARPGAGLESGPWHHVEASAVEAWKAAQPPPGAPWLHPVKHVSEQHGGSGFWSRDESVFAGDGEGAPVMTHGGADEYGKAGGREMAAGEGGEGEGGHAAAGLSEDDRYADISRETYEAPQYPREVPADLEVEKEEREKEMAKESAKEEEDETFPKYIVGPKSVREGYDFDGELKKEEEKVEEEKAATEEKQQELDKEQQQIDEEKRELQAQVAAAATTDAGEQSAASTSTGRRVANNERRLWGAHEEGQAEAATSEEASAGGGSADGGVMGEAQEQQEQHDHAAMQVPKDDEKGGSETAEEGEAAEAEFKDPSKPYSGLPPHEFKTPALGDKEPPEFSESREYYDDQLKDDPNGLWGDWRRDPLGLPKGVEYKAGGSRMQSLAAIRRGGARASSSSRRYARRDDPERQGRGRGRLSGSEARRSNGGSRAAAASDVAGTSSHDPSVFPALPVSLPQVQVPRDGLRDNGFGASCGAGGCRPSGSAKARALAADGEAAEQVAASRGLGGESLRGEGNHGRAYSAKGTFWVGLERDQSDRSGEQDPRGRGRSRGGLREREGRREEGGESGGAGESEGRRRNAEAAAGAENLPLADLTKVHADDRLRSDKQTEETGVGTVPGEKVLI